jgi:hypothetical protein
MNNHIYNFIINEETNFKTVRVPITKSKDWNMHEHIERCTNVSNGWYHSGNNDGSRPYKDIVTPVLNVATRLEGFDVKDIISFVNNAEKSYKSFLIKKYHPKWARNNELDTFIDELVDSSIVYDLALVKRNTRQAKPELVKLQQIAFCDQTDVLGGPLCLRHEFSPADLDAFRGTWQSDQIDIAIGLSQNQKVVSQANNKTVSTPGKYIEVYELHGNLPESWLLDDGNPDKYIPQLHIVAFYKGEDGNKNGITLYKGKSKNINELFKALVIKPIFGRACGRSIVETLFDPQVWANYSEQKIKKLLDSAINIFQTADEEIAGQPIENIKENTILKHQDGKPLQRVDGTLQNLAYFQNYQTRNENDARIIGSASETALGVNPVSGTPLGTTQLVAFGGQGIHEHRQGKVATFFADVLYRDWILQFLVDEMNNGKTFSEELSTEEMFEIADAISQNKAEKQIIEEILKGKIVTEADRRNLIQVYKDGFLKGGNRKFFEAVKDELKNIPLDVYVNVKGKQRYMPQNADKITNIVREIIRNPQAFRQIPGLGKAFNQMLEESGLSAIDYSKITKDDSVNTQSPLDGPTESGKTLLANK